MRRRCVAPAAPAPRRRTSRGPRTERLLVAVATAVCSATVVVLLGLLGDAAAGWNATPTGSGEGVSTTAPSAP